MTNALHNGTNSHARPSCVHSILREDDLTTKQRHYRAPDIYLNYRAEQPVEFDRYNAIITHGIFDLTAPVSNETARAWFAGVHLASHHTRMGRPLALSTIRWRPRK